MSGILEYSKEVEKFLLKHRDLAPKILITTLKILESFKAMKTTID
ncbi:hypothetical protein [Helicobacter sp. MIT 05-5293]|nr:hypothetical protein [Helicobacter sp. MIT 05-5293]